MGYALSWLAFRTLSREAALERLRLKPTGKHDEYARADISGQRLGEGWFLIVARGCDHALISERSLAILSADADVVACSVEEHVMFSAAECWSNGLRVWRVEHDAQKGIRHLAAQGSLPAGYGDIVRRSEEQQDAEDADAGDVDFFFEVPLQLARDLTSFKHDEDHASLNDEAYEVYKPLKRAKQWWQMWR